MKDRKPLLPQCSTWNDVSFSNLSLTKFQFEVLFFSYLASNGNSLTLKINTSTRLEEVETVYSEGGSVFPHEFLDAHRPVQEGEDEKSPEKGPKLPRKLPPGGGPCRRPRALNSGTILGSDVAAEGRGPAAPLFGSPLLTLSS